MKNRNALHLSILILAVAVACSFFWHFFWSEPEKAAERLANSISGEIKKLFNLTPQININERVFINQVSPIAELATATMPISIDSTYTSTWLHSTKTISMTGSYMVKAGFDLNRGFSINIDSKSQKVVVMLPPPEVLSCELKTEDITDQHGGLINWLYPQDHQAALEQMTREAKSKALSADLLNQSKEELEKRIKAFAIQQNASIEFVYGDQSKVGTIFKPVNSDKN